MGGPVPVRLLDLTGGAGYNLPPYHAKYQGRRSPDLLNTIVRDGVNRKWPGRIPYTSAQMVWDPRGQAARFLADYRLSTGERFLVGSDGWDLFKYNAGAWDCLTPLYTTGTALFTNGSKLVVGTGAGWTAEKCTKGSPIKLDAKATWHLVDSLDVGTQTITLQSTYTETTGNGAYTLQQRFSAAAVEATQWWLRGLQADNQLIVFNGVDVPRVWNGVDARFSFMTGSPPKARFGATFAMGNILAFARLSTDPQALWHCVPGNYNDWAGSGSAQYDFHNLSGDITGIDGTHEYLYLFFEGGIRRGAWSPGAVGQFLSGGAGMIDWGQAPGIDGLAAANSLLRLGSQSRVAVENQPAALTRWAFWGIKNIYSFDGELTRAIADSVRTWIWDRLDTNYMDRIIGAVAPELRLAIWSFPSRGSGGVNTHSVALDYETGEWCTSDIGYPVLGSYDLSASDETWQSIGGTFADQPRPWRMPGISPTPVTLAGDFLGYVHYLALGANDNGAAISARRRTPTISARNGRALEISTVTAESVAPAGSHLTIRVYGADNAESLAAAAPLEEKTAIVGAGQITCYFRAAAKYLALEVANGEATEDLGVTAVTAWVQERGR